MDEARLKETETGFVADSAGWFVLNVGEMSFETMPGGGAWAAWEPEGIPQQYGIGVHVLWPGDSPGRYHAESDQEGFLVLSGECVSVAKPATSSRDAYADLDRTTTAVRAPWPPR